MAVQARALKCVTYKYSPRRSLPPVLGPLPKGDIPLAAVMVTGCNPAYWN